MTRISKATEYNWKKLNCDSTEKLTKRANKTQSKKRVVANSYLDFAPANLLLSKIMKSDASIESIMYSLCISMYLYVGVSQHPWERQRCEVYLTV